MPVKTARQYRKLPGDLTPVQKIGNMYFKRDDLYAPFGVWGGVNGGKLRQCMMLVEEVQKREPGISGLVTYCSIHSPQAPITAATARHFGLSCFVAYGGTSKSSIAAGQMPRLAMRYGAKVEIVAGTGRHNVLKARAEAIAAARNCFLVQYGINLDDFGSVLLGAVAEQVQNIPDGIDDLYITCGSGITASGVIIGIEKYGKNVRKVHLIATAFDRQEKVRATLRKFGVNRDFIYHDLFHAKGFSYEKRQSLRVGGIKLHPNYEAKALRYVFDNGLNVQNALLWIVGSEPGESAD